MFIFLVVVGVLALGVRFFVNERLASENPPGMEIQYVEHGSLSPLRTSTSPLAQMQSYVDRASEAAMREQWMTASREVQNLDSVWKTLSKGLTPVEEQQIQSAIQKLDFNVIKRDQQAVLQTARELTFLISQLTE